MLNWFGKFPHRWRKQENEFNVKADGRMLFIHLLTKNYTQVEYRGTSAKRGGKVYIILRCDQQIITGSNHRSEKGFFSFLFFSPSYGTSDNKRAPACKTFAMMWPEFVYSATQGGRRLKKKIVIVYTHTTSEKKREREGCNRLFFLFLRIHVSAARKSICTHMTKQEEERWYLTVEDQLSQPEALWPRFYNTPVDLTSC